VFSCAASLKAKALKEPRKRALSKKELTMRPGVTEEALSNLKKLNKNNHAMFVSLVGAPCRPNLVHGSFKQDKYRMSCDVAGSLGVSR
jgi:hypothetical protein